MSTKTRKFDPWTTPTNDWQALEWVTRNVVGLENARPLLLQILRARHQNPAFHNLQIELANLDYELRQLAPERDPDTGEVLHPNDIPRGVR